MTVRHRQTYEGLNGLRGIAAIAVVIFHARGILGFNLAGSGELAVDFFFMLSGFVIAYAYDTKLSSAMTIRSFVMVRLRRLYPIYALGLLVGLAVIVGLFTVGAPMFPLWQPIVALVLALLFLPLLPSAYSDQLLYPLNPPSWSLAVEMVVNVLYAALHRWATTITLLACSGLALMALVIAVALDQPAIDGAQWSVIGYGYLRALFSFPVGVLLYRFRHRLPKVSLPLSALCLAALLVIDPGRYGPSTSWASSSSRHRSCSLVA